jgi:hypothetical protein
MFQIADKNKLGVLLAFYFIAHAGLFLIPNAVYWDDWVLYRADKSVIYELFHATGSMFNLSGHLHAVLLEIGPWAYKVSTFILMFGSGLLLNHIIKRHAEVKEETRFLIVLLFLCLPFNIARVTMVLFPYALCYFLFFLAWLLMDRFRIVALILFFLSFNTNSFLVFYAVPMLDMFYRSEGRFEARKLFRFCTRRLDYMLLPFLFFFVKMRFYSPSGLYAGYNQHYTLKGLFCVPIFQLFAAFDMYVNVVLVLLFSLLSYRLLRGRLAVSFATDSMSWKMLILGAFVFIFGAIPYWILGTMPTFLDWDSRHQLLLPLGSAMVIVAIYSFKGFRGKEVFLTLILGVSLAFNVTKYSELFIDWQKQVQLMNLFRNSGEIANAGLVLIDDKTERFNAFNRQFAYYEFNGLLEAAFENQNHFGIQKSDYSKYLAGEYDDHFVKVRKAGSFKKENELPQVLVKIDSIKPKGFYERVVSRVFPKLFLSVSEIDANHLLKQ